MVKWLLFVSTCIIFGIPPASIGRAQEVQGEARVIDGDTLEVDGTRVRLQGIDAPENRQWCRDRDGNRYACGQIASRALRDRIAGGTVVCNIETRDRYERSLGVCHVREGEKDLNGWLVSEGHALAYRDYSLKYVQNEEEAKKNSRGIWAGDLIAPWHWRRGKRLGRESSKGALRYYDDNRDGKITCPEARRHNIVPVRQDHIAYPFMRDGDGDGRVCD